MFFLLLFFCQVYPCDVSLPSGDSTTGLISSGCVVRGSTVLDIYHSVGPTSSNSNSSLGEEWFQAGMLLVLMVGFRLLTYIILRYPSIKNRMGALFSTFSRVITRAIMGPKTQTKQHRFVTPPQAPAAASDGVELSPLQTNTQITATVPANNKVADGGVCGQHTYKQIDRYNSDI